MRWWITKIYSIRHYTRAPSNKRMQQTARVFKRKAIAFMRRADFSHGLGHLARRLVTPQLMGRPVRQLYITDTRHVGVRP